MPPSTSGSNPNSRWSCGNGDAVILDNLAVHRSPSAAAILRAVGAWFLLLPPYSPDFNLIELAFSKLKAHLRRIGARTLDALWRAVGEIRGLFDPDECWNHFRTPATCQIILAAAGADSPRGIPRAADF